jgi:hypothetical protein
VSIVFAVKISERKKSIYRIMEDLVYKSGYISHKQYYLQRKSTIFGFITLWRDVNTYQGDYQARIEFTDIKEAERFIVKLKSQNNLISGTVTNIIKEIKV